MFCVPSLKTTASKVYLDTGSTRTTLLDIDVVRLGIVWKNLEQTKCITATGEAYPYVLPKVKIYLSGITDEVTKLHDFELEKIHLMPPENPLSVIPIQYEFGFSFLGLDILQNFRLIELNWLEKIVTLET